MFGAASLLRRLLTFGVLGRLGYNIVAEILRGEGDEPTGTPADLERLKWRFYGYKKSYMTLKKEVKQFRKHQPLCRTEEELAAIADKPSVIVASLPKSGTKYVGSTLSRTLGYDNRDRSLCSGSFPNNMILPHMAAEFALGGMALSAHIQCTPANMAALLEAGIDRMVLHVRDPRATLYSWAHYVRKRDFLHQKFGDKFFSLSEEEQIDRHIDDFFAKSVRWLTEWSAYLDSDPEMQVLVTLHEQLAHDEHAFFRAIFEFYGFSPDALKTAPKDQRMNFRSGSTTEWRENIAPAQTERMTAMIPKRLFDRFGWVA